MPELRIVIPSAALAAHLVGGVPALARIMRAAEQGLAAVGQPLACAVCLPGANLRDSWVLAEMERLAPLLEWRLISHAEIGADEDGLYVCVENLPDRAAFAAALAGAPVAGFTRDPALAHHWAGKRNAAIVGRKFAAVGWALIRATGKLEDGIVSRFINRPISRRITAFVLRWRAVRPIHATIAAAIIGLLMAVALVFGGAAGLMWGAVLLQIASVVDGVDGEIARVTLRTSARGATLDSVTDGLTNLAFVGGLACNLWRSGNGWAGLCGLVACGCLGLGQLGLGLHARRTQGLVHFDAIKHRLGQRPSVVRQALLWFVMRDFLAAASMVAVLLGFSFTLLVVFAVVASGWLLVVGYHLMNAWHQSDVASNQGRIR